MCVCVCAHTHSWPSFHIYEFVTCWNLLVTRKLIIKLPRPFTDMCRTMQMWVAPNTFQIKVELGDALLSYLTFIFINKCSFYGLLIVIYAWLFVGFYGIFII